IEQDALPERAALRADLVGVQPLEDHRQLRMSSPYGLTKAVESGSFAQLARLTLQTSRGKGQNDTRDERSEQHDRQDREGGGKAMGFPRFIGKSEDPKSRADEEGQRPAQQRKHKRILA